MHRFQQIFVLGLRCYQFPGSFDELERRRRIVRLSTLAQLCYVALAAFGIRRLELLVNLLNLVDVWAHSITKLRRFIHNWCWIITYRFCALGSVCVRVMFQVLRVYTEILCLPRTWETNDHTLTTLTADLRPEHGMQITMTFCLLHVMYQP